MDALLDFIFSFIFSIQERRPIHGSGLSLPQGFIDFADKVWQRLCHT
jgi:hypothetical protein